LFPGVHPLIERIIFAAFNTAFCLGALRVFHNEIREMKQLDQAVLDKLAEHNNTKTE
jgi:hypothetical protein